MYKRLDKFTTQFIKYLRDKRSFSLYPSASRMGFASFLWGLFFFCISTSFASFAIQGKCMIILAFVFSGLALLSFILASWFSFYFVKHPTEDEQSKILKELRRIRYVRSNRRFKL
jgi:peptidoglycan/LPS O-acetylase OafA/YrhL